jgi:hypothetical protein
VQLAIWIDSVRRLLAHEPDEAVAHVKVRQSARQLAEILVDRRFVDGPTLPTGTDRVG